jgi:Mor family transcriptional regulator
VTVTASRIGYGFYSTYQPRQRTPHKPTKQARDVAAMWADYQAGASIKEVAAKHRCSLASVYRLFKQAEFGPLRDDRGRKFDGKTNILLQDHLAGMSVSQIATKHEMTYGGVYERFRRAGVTLRRPDLTEKMWQDYLEGATVAEVAAKYRRATASVYERFSRAGLVRVRDDRRRPRPLDIAKIETMRRDYADGMSVAQLAARHKITIQTVYRWFKRAGIPVRGDRVGNTITIPNGVAFAEANRVRSRLAAQRRIREAETVDASGLSTLDLIVVAARTTNPNLSLAELGALCGMSKDAYAARLRRALQRATQNQNQGREAS